MAARRPHGEAGPRSVRAESGQSLTELGANLRDARLRAGLSVAELARRLGISAPYVSVFERGQRVPSEAVLIRAAGVLGLPVVELFALAGHRLDADAWPTRPLLDLALQGGSISDESKRQIDDLIGSS